MSKEDFSRSFNKSKELCFDENEFFKDSFSVDEFLREHRNKASLEVMRDDLGTHLKTLRLSMIELINKDYEDFVNLSRDLVGLDSRIRKIQIPLEQIKNELMEVKIELEEAISGFQNLLKQHRDINDRKRRLIHKTQVITCTSKLKNILKYNDGNENPHRIDHIERAAMELNHLWFSVTKCDRDLSDSQKKEANEISVKVMNILNNKFLECLKNKNVNELVKCLKIYAGLDRVKDLESLVRFEVVAPKLSEIITEEALQREPDGISFVYSEIINFIEKDLMDLLEAIKYCETPALKGHNFLLNSLWPELEKRINLPIMFAPGNPKLFHIRYSKSVELVNKLEILCGNESSPLKLRQNSQYQHFFQKWNLQVYYKIRFQEIAGQLEKCLDEVAIGKPLTISGENNSFSSYSLRTSSTVMEQIKKCWKSDIYLIELSHSFWKLSLQILSRYTIWVKEMLNKEENFLEKRKIELGPLQTSYGMDNFQVRSRLDFLVCLFSDTNKLLGEVDAFLENCKEKIPNGKLMDNELSLCLNESLAGIRETLPNITESIVKVIVSESAIHFRQISQIPRLFRRTNRKSSTEPCEYVGQVLNFPNQFREWKKNMSSDVLELWFTIVFNELTNQFYVAVQEVLTNAQKTEESLRKLKKKKDNFSNKNSGDEEIRQQLVIDVHSFCDGVKNFNVQKENVSKLKELVDLVESARNQSEKQ